MPPPNGDSALHKKTWHRLNIFRPPWTCGQCESKLYLWCMHCKACTLCLAIVESLMGGRVSVHEDSWYFQNWKSMLTWMPS